MEAPKHLAKHWEGKSSSKGDFFCMYSGYWYDPYTG